MNAITKNFAANVANLGAANDFVETCFESFDQDIAKKFNVLLVLEEAFVNICHYAYPNGDGDVAITCRTENDSFVMEIADKGSPFNVLSLPDPDTTLDIAERPIGGLGILLIRTMSSSASYRRENEQNILRMVFVK